MKPFINTYEDMMEYLDEQVTSVPWDQFYEARHPAPFVVQNELPDENLVELLQKDLGITTAVELGCGEGRNAIYLAKQGIAVTAFDLSATAIETARSITQRDGVPVEFHCQDVLKTPVAGGYDLVYDSGMLHHLPPHRRITYIELLQSILKPGGYFGLTCFAWGENCGDEVDDWEFYKQGFRAGVAFTQARLIDLFGPHFDVIEIRKYRNGIPGTIQGLQFMWVCLFQKKRTV